MPKNELRILKTLTSAAQDYLKVIYKLRADGADAATSAIAQRMGVTASTVTTMLKRLQRVGLIAYTPYRAVELTPAGQQVALELIRHHRLLELYLHRAMGYRWDEVDAEAEALEHHISEEFEDRIDRMLGSPRIDPHGDPIPTREGVMPPPRGKPLADSQPGETVVVLRVRDSNPEVLRYLASIGMGLEVVIEVKDKQPFNGPLTLSIGSETHSVGQELAEHVFVERCSEEAK